MKKLAFILLIYNLVSIQLLYSDWIYKDVYVDLWIFGQYATKWYNVFNFLDFPIYVIWGLMFFIGLKKFRKKKKYFTNFQWFCNFGCLSFLIMKWTNSLCECIKLQDIIFWGNFIVGFTFFAYFVCYYKLKR